MTPIMSVGDLARHLRTTVAILREIARDVRPHYRTWIDVNKRIGKRRPMCEPAPVLKRIQKLINANILDQLCVDDSAHGGVKGRSPKTNAAQHLGMPVVVTIDIQSFFPHVRHTRVHQLFRRDLGFGRDVAYLLTRLTTLNAELPQGTPTSTTLANIIMTADADAQVSERARATGLVNTRFIDDFAFSGTDPRPMINDTAKLLARSGLPISRKASKLKIMPRSGPQLVTGLTVNGRAPSVPRKYRDAVRSSIHQLSKLPPGAVRDRETASVRGQVRHVTAFNPGAGRRLSSYLDRRCSGR